MADQDTRATAPVAVITGAGSGVGRDTALLLAEAGYDLVLVARTEDKLKATARLIAEEHPDYAGHVEVMPGDVADAERVKAIIDAVADKFGRLDALANVAGYAPIQPMEKLTPDIVRDCLDVNLAGVAYAMAAAIPHMRKAKAGVIVNISSMAALDPYKGFQMYAAAKVGVNMLTRCLADEYGRAGLRAVAIAPGAIETPMLRANFNTKLIPEDKALDPMVVAALVRDCVTGRREFENGECIPLPSP